MTTRTPGTEEDWDLASGLPNDVDAWIQNAHFGGGREEYAEAASREATVLTLPLCNADGEEVGSQGYSVGAGWVVSEDGQEISHPVRKNIVRTSLYGQLIKRVKDELGVEMAKLGTPFNASTWNNLGFHWLLEGHDTVSGDRKEGLMPTEYLNATPPFEGGAAPGATVEKGAQIPEELDKQLTELAKANTVVNFQRRAVRLPAVAELSDEAMAYLMDRAATGYWAQHRE